MQNAGWLIVVSAAVTLGCPGPGNTDAGMDSGVGGDGGSNADAGPVDLDIAVVRFNLNGTLDPTFGEGGVARIDLGAGAGTVRDNLWSVTRDSADRVVLFGSTKTAGRADADRAVVRLTADGAVDTSFGTNGIQLLNIGNYSDNARGGLVQPDGKIVSTGYTSQPTGVGAQSSPRVVIQRLDSAGVPDSTFGVGGVVNSTPFSNADGGEWGIAESYAVAMQGNRYVSGGYGRSAPSGPTNQIAFRYSSSGVLDPTWGNNGVFEFDLVGSDDRVRNLVVLRDDRVLLLGSGSPTTGQIDAMATMLTSNGVVDTSFNALGYKLFSFGRPDEAWFGTALSPTGSVVAAVGHCAGGGEDDDSTLLLLPVAIGAPAEFARPMPTSDTGNDRFTSVVFDLTGKVVAAGFVVEAGDSRMVVARFNADGSRDLSFGTGGIAKINVSVGTTDEIARAVVIQSDGKIIIAGVADHLTAQMR